LHPDGIGDIQNKTICVFFSATACQLKRQLVESSMQLFIIEVEMKDVCLLLFSFSTGSAYSMANASDML
jgi:hypothetical protein